MPDSPEVNETLADIIAKNGRHKAFLTRMENTHFTPALTGEITDPASLLETLEEAKERLEVVREFTNKIIEHPESTDEQIDAQDAYVKRIKAVLRQVESKLRPEPKVEQRVPTGGESKAVDALVSGFKSMTELHKANVKLPEITLEKFAGGHNCVQAYNVFMEIFNALIHEDKSLQEIHKVNYLRASLVGEALSLVADIPPIGRNYKIYLDRLRERYGNESGQSALLTGKLLDINRWERCNTPEAMRKLCDHVRKYSSLLEMVDPSYSSDNTLIARMVIRLLPRRVVFELMKVKEDQRNNLPFLIKFIECDINSTREAEAHFLGLGGGGALRKSVPQPPKRYVMGAATGGFSDILTKG